MEDEMTIDDELRAAFEALADRAPHPARLQAGLADATRRHRQRRSLLLAAGTAVAGGGALAAAFASGRTVPQPGRTPTLTPVPTPTLPANPRIPLSYGPGFLPAGLTERIRSVVVNGAHEFTRVWASEATSDDEQLSLGLFVPRHYVPSGTRTTINGRAARSWGGAKGAGIDLTVPEGILEILANGFADNAGAALAVAESIQPDDATLEIPFGLGWLPVGWSAIGATVESFEASPRQQSEGIAAAVGDFNLVVNFEIHPGPAPLWPDGEAVTVRGLPGLWHRRDATTIDIGVPMPDSRWLRAHLKRGTWDKTGAIDQVLTTEEDALRIVEELRIGPPAAYEWAGPR
jgi:hypothetical protein